MRHFLIVPLLLLACVPVVSGQTWRELYERGEYEQAAALLHPLVFDALRGTEVPFPDPDATEALAQMYLRGNGVAQDRVLGCSFAMLAMTAGLFHYGSELDPRTKRLDRLQADVCGPLTTEERLEAGRMMGCPKYGPERQVFALAPDHSVEVSRRGIRVEYRGKEQFREADSGCLHRSALVQYTRVDPPNARTGSTARHMLELFTWVPTPDRQRALMWELMEIAGSTTEWRAAEKIAQEPGSTWMPLAVPPGLEGAVFAMRADGEVRWHFAESAPAGVLAPLPPEAPPLAPPLPATGTAHVDVTVTDRYGTALAGAAVRLSGVVSREATTNGVGAAVFEDLPDGRYDVVASKKGLASSVPQVLDLTASEGATIAVRLKPYGRTSVTIACGGFDSRSLAGLAKGADMVVHVIVADQHTIEIPSENGNSGSLNTSNEVRVIQAFWTISTISAAVDSIVTIVQGGGRADRGDAVDMYSFNQLPPLNIGDEYVLFLKRNADGAWWIEGAEEGVFRIRNGRVEPLGQGGAPETWKGRAADRFFEELRKLGPAR